MISLPTKIDNGFKVSMETGAGPRNPHWPEVEKAYAKEHLNCEACDPSNYGKVGIQVHHIHAFHICKLLGRPDLELDPRNFKSLCETEYKRPAENHHLLLGHAGDFQTTNEFLLEDIITYKGMTEQAIKESSFVTRMNNRPKPFPIWTDEEKVMYRKMLDLILPPDRSLCAKYGFTIKPYSV